MTEETKPREYGRVLPPYGGVTSCANIDCRCELAEPLGAFLFQDLEASKLRLFCGDCAPMVELNRPDRFKLVLL